MKLVIDPSKSLGPVKPVNGVGQPPFFGFDGFPMFRYLKEAGIPFSRLHDTGGMFGRNVLVDIPNVFRDFDADETDPANYDFAFTDLLVDALVENGVEPFYRLGVTIENYATIRRYRIDPPKDFAKWARICEHVIRHYTEGWADGFHHNITHWEIWNEPENWIDEPEKNQMWHGSFEEYCRLYEVASKHLKDAFPHLKIGGYGSCGVMWINAWKVERARHHVECFHAFLKFVRERGCPLDFFSWHSYSGVAAMMEQARYVREHLDAAGFANVPSCLDEWLPEPSHEKLGSALQAAEVAAALIALQNGPVDSAAIYDARCGLGNYSPLFNPFTYGPHKAYWAFVAFNELRKRGTAVEIRECGAGQPAFALAAGREAAIGMQQTDAPRPAPPSALPAPPSDPHAPPSAPHAPPSALPAPPSALHGNPPCEQNAFGPNDSASVLPQGRAEQSPAPPSALHGNPPCEQNAFGPNDSASVLPQGRAGQSPAALAVHAAAAKGADGSLAVMLANPSDTEVPLALELADAAVSATRCRIVDDARTWEETALPSALPPRSVLLSEFA